MQNRAVWTASSPMAFVPAVLLVESVMSPPELPPRNIPMSAGPSEAKDLPLATENPRAPEVTRLSLSETLFQRLQSMDTSG